MKELEIYINNLKASLVGLDGAANAINIVNYNKQIKMLSVYHIRTN